MKLRGLENGPTLILGEQELRPSRVDRDTEKSSSESVESVQRDGQGPSPYLMTDSWVSKLPKQQV